MVRFICEAGITLATNSTFEYPEVRIVFFSHKNNPEVRTHFSTRTIVKLEYTVFPQDLYEQRGRYFYLFIYSFIYLFICSKITFTKHKN